MINEAKKVGMLIELNNLIVDLRVVFVLFPIVLALSWAGYNIGRAALGQIQLAIYQFKKNTRA